MNVVIRTDSSLEIGTGHVMRCVTLAHQLVKQGVEVSFICRNFSGNTISYLKDKGFRVDTLSSFENQQWMQCDWEQDAKETKKIIYNLKKKINLLIVDHYGLDAKWESELRSVVDHIMVIDDLANRPHNCDILLDQNYYLEIKKRYTDLVPESCIQLLGPNYALLRNEFLSIDTQKIKREGKVKNILVFFGGTDPTGETLKTLKAIKEVNRSHVKFNIVVGEKNPKISMIKEICEQIPNTVFQCQVSNIAELMVNADLAIGAGGTTSLERCYVGLPSIVIIVADNQRDVSNALAKIGVAFCLGESEKVTVKDINKAFDELCNKESVKLKNIIKNSWDIINRDAVKAQLVTKKILEFLK
jgi:UDP-2,4-diacetamido-2,4,6-trideoxy-beta-L-altropyranose hydrolase